MDKRKIKLIDLIKDFVYSSSSPGEAYAKLGEIQANTHFYLGQWNGFSEESKVVGDVIRYICRLEAGYQLCGLGIWLLTKIFTSCPKSGISPLFGTDAIIEDLLRIGLEHALHDKAFYLLQQLCISKIITFKKVYDTGD